MPDYRDVVPAHLLITAVKNAGILVGAFDGTEMVGFAFGFLGSEVRDGVRHLKHTSHMLAVAPDARMQGLGARLKWFQRAVAQRQGLDLMTWTYDPLQAVNARLNLVHLGAIARRYYRNVYGDMTDALNAGVTSDRFEVEWHLDTQRTVAHAAIAAPSVSYDMAQRVYSVEWDDDALPHIAVEDDPDRETLLVEIPANFLGMKNVNPLLAIEWRERTRKTFERAFASDYVAHDVLSGMDESGRSRVCYVLARNFEVGI